MSKTTIYTNNEIQIYIDSDKSILYVDVIDGTYNKKFLEAIEYYKNFWLLVNNTMIYIIKFLFLIM